MWFVGLQIAARKRQDGHPCAARKVYEGVLCKIIQIIGEIDEKRDRNQ